MLLQIKITVSILLLLITTTVFSQTASDTASIIGTGQRAIPKPMLVKPDPIEPFESSSKQSPPKNIDKKTSTNKIVGNQYEVQKASFTDTAAEKAYYNSLIAYYKAIEKKNLTDAKTIDSVGSYYTWALKNRQSIIQRQQITGSLIFGLVTILLLSGLLFSAIQFRIALKNVKKKSLNTSDTTFKASLAGIEVSSSILGVIILAISLGFFYLYLTNVYPLVSLDQLPPQTPGK